jgi:hypothetical protein
MSMSSHLYIFAVAAGVSLLMAVVTFLVIQARDAPRRKRD